MHVPLWAQSGQDAGGQEKSSVKHHYFNNGKWFKWQINFHVTTVHVAYVVLQKTSTQKIFIIIIYFVYIALADLLAACI